MSRKGWGLFAVMCVVWGIPYLFIKVAVEEVSVPVVVFARTALAAVLLLPLAVHSASKGASKGGGQLAALRRHWRPGGGVRPDGARRGGPAHAGAARCS